MSLTELETDLHIEGDDLRDINQRIFLPMLPMATMCATFAFLSIYGVYLIVVLLWYWKHRNHYPIRGKAPLLSLLFMASLIGA
jgi:tellurite resistance protein TehA-like permease